MAGIAPVVPTRVLITGGAGFVGAALARRCLARGDEVHLLVRAAKATATSLGRVAALGGRVHVHRVDLADRADVDACLAAVAPDAIFHLAVATRIAERADLGDTGESLADLANLMTLVAAAAAARRPPRSFVRCGSLAEYGAGPTPALESQREQPLTSYAAALVAGTHYLAAVAPRLPFRAVTARLALVYGEGQADSFFVAHCVVQLLAGSPVTIRRPRDRRDLIHIDDAVEGLLAAADGDTPLVNIATGIAPTMAEVAAMIADAAGADQALIACDWAPAPVSHLRCSPVLAADRLGWRAQIPVAEGVARTVAALAAADPRKACRA